MTRTKIRIDTMSDVNKFVATMGKIKDRVWLEDDEGNRVNAKSLLGALYSLEWSDIYCYSETDISSKLLQWMV